MKNKEIKLRCWIDIDQKKYFGPGPAELLRLIEREGSIAKAAKTMGMSYKKAWDLITDLNTRGKSPFVISRKGGERGGGAKLTPNGKEFLEKYEELIKRLNAIIIDEKNLLELI